MYSKQDRTGDSIAASNVLRNESSSEEGIYSKLNFPEAKKRVKPPAILPKTYNCEPNMLPSLMPCPTVEEIHTENDDICSVGSDSLYDMKLEEHDEKQLPEQNENCESLQITNEQASPQEPDVKSSPDKYFKSKLPKQSLAAGLGTSEFDKHHGSEYQTLDTKTFSPPSVYENIDSLVTNKKLITKSEAKTSQRNFVPTYKHHQSHATVDSHYEALQLKTMNKKSEYQHVVLKKTS